MGLTNMFDYLERDGQLIDPELLYFLNNVHHRFWEFKNSEKLVLMESPQIMYRNKAETVVIRQRSPKFFLRGTHIFTAEDMYMYMLSAFLLSRSNKNDMEEKRGKTVILVSDLWINKTLGMNLFLEMQRPKKKTSLLD